MNLLSRIKFALARSHRVHWMILLLAAVGCERSEIKTYRLSKEAPAAPQAQHQHQHQVAAGTQSPGKLTWTLPAGWKEVPPSEMRAASFLVTGKDNQTAEVAVIPLPSAGSEVDLVNMWRQTMQLPPITREAAATQAETITISSDQGKLFDIPSTEPILNGKARARILVAIATRGSTSWYFKMTGEEAFVREQKPVFAQFLKSISFTGEGQPAAITSSTAPVGTGAPVTASADPGKPTWTVPAGWQELPPGQMLAAKFLVAASGESRTEVNVGTAAGGTLLNVNRWRAQVGLGQNTEEELKAQSKVVDLEGGSKALFVDMSGTDGRTGRPARILGIIVPRDQETWFYKLMGDPQVAEQQKDVFTKFVQTVKYPNVR